jgi:hypothetical protein
VVILLLSLGVSFYVSRCTESDLQGTVFDLQRNYK